MSTDTTQYLDASEHLRSGKRYYGSPMESNKHTRSYNQANKVLSQENSIKQEFPDFRSKSAKQVQEQKI